MTPPNLPDDPSAVRDIIPGAGIFGKRRDDADGDGSERLAPSAPLARLPHSTPTSSEAQHDGR